MYELIAGEIELTMGQYSVHKATPRARIPHEHAAIIDAVRSGDPDAATERLSAHLSAARQRVLSRITKQSGSLPAE
jgi:DNA-binding GntR family transcriptional regulator